MGSAIGEIAKLLGKAEPEKVTIDIGAALGKITMHGLNAEFWPPQAPIRACFHNIPHHMSRMALTIYKVVAKIALNTSKCLTNMFEYIQILQK